MSEKSPKQLHLEKICREAYEATRVKYGESGFEGSDYDFGFKILNGPPLYGTPILFLGYQPGGGLDARQTYLAAHETWNPTFEYLEPNIGLLWDNVRAIFDNDEFLKQCVAMNSIYFRAPRVADWRNVLRGRRQALEEHCLANTKKIISAMCPSLIVVNGMLTMRLFTHQSEIDIRLNNRTLTRETEIEGIRALATLHLSGARISVPDRNAINERIREKSGFERLANF